MRRPWLFPLLVFLGFVVVGAGVFLVREVWPVGKYVPPPRQASPYEQITLPPLPASAFYQAPLTPARGMVLVDQAHVNMFLPAEIHSLTSLILAQGFSLASLEKRGELEEKLRQADAFIVISPWLSYSAEEVALVRRFADRGGKLLLISDPARLGEINSLAPEFGATFEEDYLYNLKENAGNYRYIVVRDFQPHPLTQGIKSLALWVAGSISTKDQGLAFGDAQTLSSLYHDLKKPSPIALSQGSRVLLLHDLTFLREPFMTTLDNSRLVANIASWLTQSERAFVLSDFPHFFREAIAIAYADPSLLDMAVELRDFLLEVNKKPEVGERRGASPNQDLVFLGLFRHASQVEEYLAKGNIQVTVPGEISGRMVDKETEDPIEGGLVAAVSAEGTFETPTQGDGSYTFSGLPAATYELTASGRGYQEKKATLKLEKGGKAGLDFSLAPLGKGNLKGCVTDGESRKPIPKAEVVVEGTQRKATTNDEGCYLIEGLFQGTYRVTASAEGYKPSTQEAKVAPGQTATANLTLSPGEAEPELKGSIQGAVKDADSEKPVEKAEVVVRGTKHSASTDRRGSYSLRDLPQGTYQVTVRAQGYKTVTKKVRVVGEETVRADFDLATPLLFQVKELGKLHQMGTSILYFYPSPERRVLILLADTTENLREALKELKSGGFRKELVGDLIAVRQEGE